ncbi:MAG TPA: hypothetical protein VMI12_01815 [Puia sp.]|nr:hypothetical protein [Puia sp.]
MKKYTLLLLIVIFVACRNNKAIPDVSNIPLNLRIERFDKAFFELDSNHIVQGLHELNQQFPYFTYDFVAHILGAGPLTDTNQTAFIACRQFLISYLPVKDSIELQFEKMQSIEKDLKKGFQLVKYYFPDYHLPPKVVSYIGPFDAPGVAITRYTLAIGLQLYAGKDFSFYKSVQGQELYPGYISRRFEAPYIVPNCMKAIAEDLFPDSSGDKPLIDQMIEKGKYWWLIDQFLPETDDSLKTGFTEKQLNWCKSNEGLIWNFFLQGDIYTIDPDLIKNYIGDAPHTQGMPDASPGNIGQWVGWQIVKKFAAEHGSMSAEQIMKTTARKIFEESKYKPK